MESSTLLHPEEKDSHIPYRRAAGIGGAGRGLQEANGEQNKRDEPI